MTRETQRAHLLVLNGWKAPHAGSPQRGPQFEPTDQHQSSIPKHPNSRYGVFYGARTSYPENAPKRNMQDTRTGPRNSEILPTPEVARTSQIPTNLENDIRKTSFPPKLRRIPATTTKNVPRTTGAIFTHRAKNEHRTQAKRHFLHTR